MAVSSAMQMTERKAMVLCEWAMTIQSVTTIELAMTIIVKNKGIHVVIHLSCTLFSGR